VELSLERRMREPDVGSQSADTIKLSFSCRCDPRGRNSRHMLYTLSTDVASGNFSMAPQPVFVAARTTWGRARAVHIFDLLVPGQVRGLSPLVAALSPAHSKATLREFTLAAAFIQSMTATTIESDMPTQQALTGDVALSELRNARQWRAFANRLSVSGLRNWPLWERNRR
jgi:capsid protein